MNIDKLLDEADVLISMHKYDQAIEKYNNILELFNDCADAYLMRGAVYGQIGKIDSAITDLEKSISLDASNDSAYLTLAHLYVRKNNEQKVVELCHSALKINGDCVEAKKLLTRFCKKLGNDMLEKSLFDRAELYFELSLNYNPSDPEVLFRMALVSRGKGKILKSIEYSERAIAVNPNHVRAKAHIASAHELLGNVEKGGQLVEQLIHDYPSHPLVCIVYAQYALRNKNQSDGINILTTLVKNNKIEKFDLISIKMLLGSLYDSLEQYDSAFEYYKQANDLQDENYDPLSYRDYVSGLINYFSIKKYPSISKSQCLTDELIFIVGMPRSGSSLIEHIVASHTDVFGAGELTHVFHLVDTMQENIFESSYPECLDNASTELMSELADKLLLKIKSENKNSNKVLKIIDKMPHNFHHIGFLYKLFPNAVFINCERDSRDTCLSCYFQHFAGYHPYACNLRAMGIHYREYQRLMHHWELTLGIPVLNVTYENIVSDTKVQVERILSFLGLEWQDKCMEFYKQKRTVATASYNQVNKNIYSRSVGRWKNYEENLGELLNALKKD